MKHKGKSTTFLLLGCGVVLSFLSCGGGEHLSQGYWQALTSNSFWRAGVEPVPAVSGNILPAVVLRFSGYAATQPGDQASVRLSTFIPESGQAELSFDLEEKSSADKTSGLFYEVLANGLTVFKQQSPLPKKAILPVRIDLRQASPRGGQTELEFRLSRGRGGDASIVQDNFEFFIEPPVTGMFIDPKLITGGRVRKLLPHFSPQKLAPIPPDLPLSSLPANGTEWTKDACIIQPWGKTQWDAIVKAAERAPWLAKEFGFNTIIILPPEAHNAIVSPAEHITEEQFERALRIYRANGFRVIMYTSIMHCGHAPVWEDGTLEKMHPEWSQRGPKGEPIRIYGRNWLCPSSGALSYTLNYTLDLVRRYNPDLVMLDNSEFFATPSGVSCYCPACQVEFRRYLRQRFGQSVGDLPTDTVTIPTESGFLYDIWISWRNRVWGEAHEIFRRELRKLKPDIVLMSNTQYLRHAPDLATDLIYDHEDALISESVGMTMDGMIDKLLLGRALARGKPLWNYLGTFELEDYERLVSPEKVAMNVSTAFACGVCPWVVYRGFYEKTAENKASLERLASLMSWHIHQKSAHGDLKPYAPALSLVSLASRNYRLSKLIPDHLAPLRHQGICSWIIEEKNIEEGIPESCLVLLIEDAPCLSSRAARAIADFIQSGGKVIASPNTASYDEIGRLRPKSAFEEILDARLLPRKTVKFGRGEIFCLEPSEFLNKSTELLKPYQFPIPGSGRSSLLPYTDSAGNFIVYVCSEETLEKVTILSFPKGYRPSLPGDPAKDVGQE